MELSPSWQAANRPATQVFPNILWKPKIYFSAHNSSPLVLILSWMNLAHSTQRCISNTILISSHLRLGHPSGLFPSGFPTQTLSAFLFSPKRSSLPTHLIPLDLIILIIFDEWYEDMRSWQLNVNRNTYQDSLETWTAETTKLSASTWSGLLVY
jgi:glucan phosphoethanolaminetransferase (alkaline phosphatase superfamily)